MSSARRTSVNLAQASARLRSGSDRRSVLLSAACGAAVAALLPRAAFAQEAQALDAALKKAVGDAKPAEGRITLTLPEIAENGNTVPFEIAVQSPMSSELQLPIQG